MEEHLKSVNTEQLHTQRLVDAKIKEIETEDHLKQLAERERGRFQAEYKKLRTSETLCLLKPIQDQFMDLFWILTEEKRSNQLLIGFVS